MSFLPCLYCYFAKIKFLFNVSDDWDNVPQDKKALWVWKIIIKPIVVRFSHGIVSISHKQFALYSKKNINTFILPNGVNTLFIEKINSFKENNEDNTVNFIANLRDWYDFDLLFDIFEELPQLQLNIFGTGPLYNILSQKAEIHKNICLMGNVSQEKTVQLLKESVIGIIPLKNNTLNDSTSPVKLFDYWAAQKAVVATPTYELQSIGADCILFAQTKEEWIKQIRFLTDNPKRRKFMGETGYDKVTDCYNYDEITRKFLEKIS
jgi:glycosyltransferase involved in cell wall biosynthesis